MGFLDRFRKQPELDLPGRGAPVPAPAPPAAVPPAPEVGADEALEELGETVELLVAGGFRTRAEIEETALEMADDEYPDLDPAAVRDLVARRWGDRLEQEQDWPATTDADRLATAFATLDAAGIVARMDFTCCQGCGTTEIDDEVPEGATPRGYTFFHQQDTERLAEDGSLFLSYGVFRAADREDYERQSALVAREVAETVGAVGLPVAWDGSTETRIEVGPLTWRRRLPRG